MCALCKPLLEILKTMNVKGFNKSTSVQRHLELCLVVIFATREHELKC